MCSAYFLDEVELSRHKQTHGTKNMEESVVQSAAPSIGSQEPQKSRSDKPEEKSFSVRDESTEEAREERGLVEGQRNDRTNALANRASIDNYRDHSEWEVNPDQTPKQTKRVQPIDYV